MEKHRQLQMEQKAAQTLTEEGAQRLAKSLHTGDFTDAQAAHTLIKGGNDKLACINEKMGKATDDLLKIQQKRSHAEQDQTKKK